MRLPREFGLPRVTTKCCSSYLLVYGRSGEREQAHERVVEEKGVEALMVEIDRGSFESR